MKTKFFLLAGILSLALTACGGDDNGEDPAKPLGNAKISFTKMANCPVAAEMQATVYNGLIYFVSGAGDFISYNPAKNEWKTLARTPHGYYSNIFVWQDELYWHGGSSNDDIYIYHPETDSWSKTEEIAPHSNYGMMFNIGDNLFLLNGPSRIGMAYQKDTRQWKKLEDETIAYCSDSFCQIDNMAYAIFKNTIYQFDPETYTTTAKINTPSYNTYLTACLYKQRQMLYSQCGVARYDEENIYATIGIYTPSTNEFSEIHINNKVPNGVTNLIQVDIPMIINKLTHIDGRIFVGPNNAAFYELKIK